MTWNELVKEAIKFGYERSEMGISKRYSEMYVTIEKIPNEREKAIQKAYEAILYMEGKTE